MAPHGPFGAFEWCRTCEDRPGDPRADGLCEVCLPRDRPAQLRNASARYRERTRARLARVPPPGSTKLDPEQTRALAEGLARLARAVDEHNEALRALEVLGTDAMHHRALDAQGASPTRRSTSSRDGRCRSRQRCSRIECDPGLRRQAGCAAPVLVGGWFIVWVGGT